MMLCEGSTNNTTVTMLQGEYVLHKYVPVCGVVSVSIYGSRSEGNGSVRENQMVVNCEYKEGGCLFTAVADFFL